MNKFKKIDLKITMFKSMDKFNIDFSLYLYGEIKNNDRTVAKVDKT